MPYQVFETADEPIVVAVGNDTQFVSFCNAISCDGLSAEPRFISNSARVQNRGILVPLIAEELAKQSVAYWISGLEQRGIPVGPVNLIGEAFADPQVIARQTVLQLERADLGSVPGVRSPIRFQNCTQEDNKAPPAVVAAVMPPLE